MFSKELISTSDTTDNVSRLQQLQCSGSVPGVTNPPVSEFIGQLSLLSMNSPIRHTCTATSTAHSKSNRFADQVLEQLNDVKKYVHDCDTFLSKRASNLNSTNAKPLAKQAKNVAEKAMQLYNSILSIPVANADDSGICADASTSFAAANTSFNTTADVKQSRDYSINAILRKTDKPSGGTSPPTAAVDRSSKRKAKTVGGTQRLFTCEFCSKSFDIKWRYETHRRTHTGEKPFVCTNAYCRKAFADCSNLRAHEKTHGEKLNVCLRCGKSFTLRSYYNKHRKSTCERNHRRNTLQTLIDDRRRLLDEQRPTPKQRSADEIVSQKVSGDVGAGSATNLLCPPSLSYVTPPNPSHKPAADGSWSSGSSSGLTSFAVASPNSPASTVSHMTELFSGQSASGSGSPASLPRAGGPSLSHPENTVMRDMIAALQLPVNGSAHPSTSASAVLSPPNTASVTTSLLSWTTLQLYLKYLSNKRNNE